MTWMQEHKLTAQRYVGGLTSGEMKPRMTSIISKALFAMSGMSGQMSDFGRRATRGELTTMPKARTICNTSHNRVKALHDKSGRVCGRKRKRSSRSSRQISATDGQQLAGGPKVQPA